MDSLIAFARVDRIAFRLVAGPSVVMDRAVVRVSRVADVMAQYARVVDDPLLYPFALVRIEFGAPQSELYAQALKQLQDSEGDESDGRGFLTGFYQFGREIVTV